MKVYFSDWFDVDPKVLEDYGAFDVSLINDLPLFIDPFLLFTSEKAEYQGLHDGIIGYLRFLRDQSAQGNVDEGLLQAWYMFPEVKQLWLGFSLKGNAGAGLGIDFARALHSNLEAIFSDFGEETITQGSHLEKVCLVQAGVGRDNISDFTANLIKPFLLDYTQTFAREHINADLRRTVSVPSVRFDEKTRTWQPATYELPFILGDYVLLTPKDMLTKDDSWINRHDFMERFEQIASSVPDMQLRSQVNDYLIRQLREDATKDDKRRAYSQLIKDHPALIEYYIRSKEERGEDAKKSSAAHVADSEEQFVEHVRTLVDRLEAETEFYKHGFDTLDECRARVAFLKAEIEKNGGWRLFYRKDQPVQRESDLQILFRLTWFATPSDFNSEVNNGRGPVDFKVSRGSKDASLVEFKLAKNSKLEQNLRNQVKVYEEANRTNKSLKVVFFFSDHEKQRLQSILKDLKLEDDDSIVQIDCRPDNKPSASNA